MAIHRTTRKPDSPAQVEAQDALRATLAAIRNHTVKNIAAQSGVTETTLYSHLTETRKYPLRVPAGRLRSVARSLESQIATLAEAQARLVAAADALDAEHATVGPATDATPADVRHSATAA